jgi:hypothetical protein
MATDQDEERRRQAALDRDVKKAKGTLVVFFLQRLPVAKAWETRIVALGTPPTKRGSA